MIIALKNASTTPAARVGLGRFLTFAVAMAGVGCTPAPPAPPVPSDMEMAVGIPAGETDPGVLTTDPIVPPSIEQVDRNQTQKVSMRFASAARLVQQSGGVPAGGTPIVPVVPVEIIPQGTPTPIADTPVAPQTDAPKPATPKPATPKPTIEPAAPEIVGPELIPTPQGEPEDGGMKPAEKAPAANDSAIADTKSTPEMSDLDASKMDQPAENAVVMPASGQSSGGESLGEKQGELSGGAIGQTASKPSTSSEPGTSSERGTSSESGFAGGLDGPEDYNTWEKPAVTLVFTGQQHGYIEPCGCTGLDRQKGGVARRYTFMDTLRKKNWDVVPMDAGNQVRRFGRQASIKLQQSVRALREMDYQAVGFGPDDIRLGVGDLLVVAAEETMFVSANVVLFDPEYLPKTKLIERGGMKIGVTSVLDPESLEVTPDDALTVGDPVQGAQAAIDEMAGSSPDFRVLLYFGKEESAKDLVRQVAGFDLVVVAGGFGEPTYQAQSISDSQTRIIVTGDKGMYAGLIGLYPDSAMRYARVPLTHEFADAPQMRGLMKDYQDQLRDVGLSGLGLLPPIPHSSGEKFAGSESCGKCHTTAYDIWESSAHFEATEHIVHPPKERGDVARHFDPECISCHVTGWNPQEYYPFESGYLSLDQTPHLTGNGCENCHGPGASHAAAEAEGSMVTALVRDQLRESMKLPLEKAREKCMECHDLDNSPDFHEPDAFEDIYWPQVEHYGKD